MVDLDKLIWADSMHLDAFHEDNKIHSVLKEHKCTMNGEG